MVLGWTWWCSTRYQPRRRAWALTSTPGTHHTNPSQDWSRYLRSPLLSTYHDVPIHASRYLRLYDTYRACIPLNCWSFMPSPSFYLPHPLSFPSTPPPLYRLFFPMTAVVPTAVLVPAISMCAFPTVTTINPHLYPHPRGMHSSSMSIAMLATRDPL